MKKFISWTVLTAMLFNFTAFTQEKTASAAPVEKYLNFTGFNGQKLSPFEPVKEHLSYVAVGNDPEGIRGENAKLTARSDTDGPLSNWNDQQNVLGFSIYVTEATRFTLNMKCNKSSGNGWLSGIFQIDGGKFKYTGSEIESVSYNRWYDIRVALDFSAHTSTLYIDGVKKGSKNIDSSFISVAYSGMNCLKTSVSGVTYIDDGVAMSTDSAMLSASAVTTSGAKNSLDIPVSKDTEYIEIDLGGEISKETAEGISAVISSKDGTVVTRTEFVGLAEHLSDYPRTMRVYIDQPLEGKESYTLTVSGVKNLIGKSMDKSFSFETESTDPAIYTDYVSTLQYGDDQSLPEGTKVNFTTTNFNLPEGDSVEVLHNGEIADNLATDERSFSIVLSGGENEIILRSVLTSAQSEPININAVSFSEELLLSKNFDDKNISDGFAGVNANDGTIDAVEVEGRNGYALKLQSAEGEGPILFPVFPTTVKGVVSIEYDACYESFFKMNLVSAIRTETGNLNPVMITETGMLQTESKENIKQLSLNTWYKFKVHFDIQNMNYSLFINDEAVIINKPFVNRVAGIIDRMNMIVNHGTGTVSTMYMDNFRQYGLARDYKSEINVYNSDGTEAELNSVSYEGMRADISFSEPMSEEELKNNISVTDAEGKKVSISGKYEGNVYSVEAQKLNPDSKYRIIIPASMRSLAGGVNTEGEKIIGFTTSKSGFHLESYLFSDGDSLEEITGTETDMIVLYANDSDKTQSGTVFAGIYKNNELYSYDTSKITAMPGSGSCTLSLKLPSDISGGDYHTEIYLVDSMEKLNVIDLFSDNSHSSSKKRLTDGTLIIEAEDMKLDSVMSVIEDSAASGGKAIKVNAANAALTVESMAARESFGVDAVAEKSGSYAVWLRVQIPNDGSNSVWYSPNTNVYSLLDFTKSSYNNDYYWVNIGYAVLKAGAFSLNFKYREKNFTVDKMIITSKLGFTPEGKDDVPDENDSNVSGLYDLPEITPVDGHPRLYLTEDIVPHLLENMQTPELETAYSIMNGYADEELDATVEYNAGGNYDELLEEKIEARALMYVLGQRDVEHAKQTIQYAKEYMSTVCYPNKQDITRKIGNAMVMTSVVYDWCYDVLTDEDKEFFISKLKEFASMKEIGYPPVKMSSIGSHAGEHEIMRDMLSAGVAIYDEDAEMYNFAAGRFFSEYVDSRKLFNSSGNHPQGSAYGTYRFESELFATAIFDRMGYANVLGEDQYSVAYKWLYERLPMGAWFKDGDDPDFGRWSMGGYTAYDATETLLSANLSRDPYLRRQYLKMLSIDNYNTKLLWLLLFAEPDAGMRETNDLPLARKTTYPLSSIVARTSWQAGFEAPTAMVQMKIQEKNLGDHMHFDSGAFQIYYKGSLATTSGLYQGKHGGHSSDHHNNYARRTIAHNTITVYDPDEKVYTPDGVTKYSNDGGQNYSGDSVIMTYEEFMAREDNAKTTGSYIGPNEYTPKFSYIKGDLTNAYSDKITDYNRSMVFMDLFDEDYPAAFVVFDKVDTSDASFEKRWHMHCMEEPSVDGNTTVITRTEGSGIWNYNGKLVNKTMLPSEPVIEKVNGFIVDGVEYPAEAYDESYPEPAPWRIDIKPSEENTSDTFLNAMYVTDADKDLPELEMTMVKSDNMTGVSVKDRLVMFSDNAKRINDIVTLEIPDNGYEKVSCLLTDMSSGIWGIETETDYFYVEVTEEEGVLYFEGAPGEYRFFPQCSGPLTVFENERVHKSETGDFLVRNWSTFAAQKYPTKEIDGVPYVPVDGIFDNMYSKAKLEFSDERNEVTVTKGSKTAVITAESDTYIYNGAEKELKNTPIMIDGQLYVVLSDFKSLLDLSYVKYDSWAKILNYY